MKLALLPGMDGTGGVLAPLPFLMAPSRWGELEVRRVPGPHLLAQRHPERVAALLTTS
jgi:hypothetical protein